MTANKLISNNLFSSLISNSVPLLKNSLKKGNLDDLKKKIISYIHNDNNIYNILLNINPKNYLEIFIELLTIECSIQKTSTLGRFYYSSKYLQIINVIQTVNSAIIFLELYKFTNNKILSNSPEYNKLQHFIINTNIKILLKIAICLFKIDYMRLRNVYADKCIRVLDICISNLITNDSLYYFSENIFDNIDLSNDKSNKLIIVVCNNIVNSEKIKQCDYVKEVIQSDKEVCIKILENNECIVTLC